MKDFFGSELAIGDRDAICRPNYRDLVMVKIIAFTPKQVRFEYRSYSGSTETYLTVPEAYIKRL